MNTDLVLAIQRRRRLARQEGGAMSEEALQAAADLATVESLRAELSRLRDERARETAVQARNEARWRGALTAAQAAVEEEQQLRARAERELLAARALLDGQKRATVALERELRETIAGLMAERDAAIKDLTAARDAVTDVWIEYEALRKDFHAILTTIGGRLYTQGTGAAWQMDLLSFVRNERERFDRSTVASEPPPPPPAAPIGHCARCGAELNNVSPGFSIVAGGAAVCAGCLRPGEEVARARSIE